MSCSVGWRRGDSGFLVEPKFEPERDGLGGTVFRNLRLQFMGIKVVWLKWSRLSGQFSGFSKVYRV